MNVSLVECFMRAEPAELRFCVINVIMLRSENDF